MSPAVIVPLMIDFIDRGKGADKGIPTMVLASATVDDVFVIVIFSVLLGLYAGETLSLGWRIAGIPISILLGAMVGLAVGYAVHRLLVRFDPVLTRRILLVLGVAILLTTAEQRLPALVPFAALLAVMAMGFMLRELDEGARGSCRSRSVKRGYWQRSCSSPWWARR